MRRYALHDRASLCWALWENIQAALDKRFKATGHQNVAFPLLIPRASSEKEKHHVEAFRRSLPS